MSRQFRLSKERYQLMLDGSICAGCHADLDEGSGHLRYCRVCVRDGRDDPSEWLGQPKPAKKWKTSAGVDTPTLANKLADALMKGKAILRDPNPNHGDREHPCPICSKRYRTSDQLNSHIRAKNHYNMPKKPLLPEYRHLEDTLMLPLGANESVTTSPTSRPGLRRPR